MQARWRAQDYTWAGGERINQALSTRDASALDALLRQNPGLLVRPFVYEDPQVAREKWVRGSLAHAVVHMHWKAGLPVLHAHGEAFERVVSQGCGEGTPTQDTAAGYAIALGQADTVEQLMGWGCDANGIPGKPLGALLAGPSNNDPRFLHMARSLARHGARLDAVVDYTLTTTTGQEKRCSMNLLFWLVHNNQPWVLMELLAGMSVNPEELLHDPQLHTMLVFSLFRGAAHAWPKTTLDEDLVSNFALIDALEARGMPPLDAMVLVTLQEGKLAHQSAGSDDRCARIIAHMLQRKDYPRQTLVAVRRVFGQGSRANGTRTTWQDAFMADVEGRILAEGLVKTNAIGSKARL